MGIFKKKREPEDVDLKELFESAEWPAMYDVVIHLTNSHEASWDNVGQSSLDALDNIVVRGSGSITVGHSDNMSTVIPASQIVYYTATRKELNLWNEDKL